jgi:hypothetical protein
MSSQFRVSQHLEIRWWSFEAPLKHGPPSDPTRLQTKPKVACLHTPLRDLCGVVARSVMPRHCTPHYYAATGADVSAVPGATKLVLSHQLHIVYSIARRLSRDPFPVVVGSHSFDRRRAGGRGATREEREGGCAVWERCHIMFSWSYTTLCSS